MHNEKGGGSTGETGNQERSGARGAWSVEERQRETRETDGQKEKGERAESV